MISLHGHLAPVAWAAAQARPGLRVGFLQGAGRGAARVAVARRRRAARARAALRPRHRRARLRRRARGDQPRRRARRGRAPARLGGDRRRPRARDPRLGDPPRPRRDGGARRRARGARARPADAALPADVELGRARRATAASATTRPRCSSCCSRRCGCRCPRPSSRAGRCSAQEAPAGRLGAGGARRADRALHGPPRPRGRADRPRRLRGQRAAGAHDGAVDRRGPAVLRRAARGRAGRWRRPSAGRGAPMERIGSKTVYEGRIVDVRIDEFRYDDGETAEREIVVHPGAVGDRRPRRRVALPRAPAARGGRRARPARAAGGQARRRGRDRRSSARSASSARRSGCAPREWTRAEALLHHARVRRGAGDALRGHRPRADRRPRARPGGADRARAPGRSADLDGAIDECADSKTLIGLLLLRRRAADGARRRVAPAGEPGGREKPAPWRSPSPEPRRRSRRALRGAGARLPRLPRVRARAGPQHARRLPHRPAAVRRLPRAPAGARRPRSSGPTSPTSSPTWRPACPPDADGNGGRAACSPATINRKTACLRSFYRHLRREELIADDPTATLSPPTKSRKLPHVLSQAEVTKLLESAARRRPDQPARPGPARGHVRVRPARLGGDRARDRRRRPAPRLRPPARQGLEGADRARSAARPRRAIERYLRSGRPELVGVADRAQAVRQLPRRRRSPARASTRSSSATRRRSGSTAR